MGITVSVVIPTYNSEAYIERSVESVLAQSRPADEIIVVDDGSTDNTAEVVGKFGDKVKYIRQENAGASAARNAGIMQASGKWIAFLDGDDEWLVDYLKEQISLLERNGDLAWCSANFYNCNCKDNHNRRIHDPETGKKLLAGSDFFGDYFQAYINAAAGWTGTMMIKREVLQEAGMFTDGQPMANDLDMWWRVAYRYPKIGYNPKPLAVYHFDVENSITKKHKSPDILSDLIAKHLEIAASLGAYDRFVPCAVHMIKYWNYVYLFDDRKVYIRNILKRFKSILPFSYRLILNAITISPKITEISQPLVKKVSSYLNIQR